jgi:diaminohydroxyphosphoribosylaminopyrimidine deaminase / 5-amino-6-(5-phosphoribosylamino)uracil reductase
MMMSDESWMLRAIELSLRCVPSPGAFSVGAVVVDGNGREMASGFSRETDSVIHAEESALAKLSFDCGDLANATLYSTLEPCSRRASRLRSCTRLIVESGIPRVVFACREPANFVADAAGYEMLIEAGVTVVELSDLADAAMRANVHLRPPPRVDQGQTRRKAG